MDLRSLGHRRLAGRERETAGLSWILPKPGSQVFVFDGLCPKALLVFELTRPVNSADAHVFFFFRSLLLISLSGTCSNTQFERDQRRALRGFADRFGGKRSHRALQGPPRQRYTLQHWLLPRVIKALLKSNEDHTKVSKHFYRADFQC